MSAMVSQLQTLAHTVLLTMSLLFLIYSDLFSLLDRSPRLIRLLGISIVLISIILQHLLYYAPSFYVLK